MQSYGNYQVDREIAAGQGTVVYSARAPGQTGPASFALKVVSPGFLTLLDVTAQEELDAHYAGLTQAALRRIELQKKAGAASKFIAPVLDHGQDGAAVWFATHLYPQSLEKVLGTRVQLNQAAVAHILLSVARGARALKTACGRSHGDLKPSNVFIGAGSNPATAAVVIADPLSAEAAEGAALERADLRAVGQLLYQLVRRKAMPAAEDWDEMLLPLVMDAEWTAVFGKAAAGWLALCNQLLDRQLSLGAVDLAWLEKELVRLSPKPAVSPLLVVAVVVLAALGGLALWWFTRPSKVGELVLQSDPAGAMVLTNGQAAGPTPWKGRFLAGTNTIIVSNELGAFTNELVVVAGRSATNTFRFEYGSAVIESAPPGASVRDAEGHEAGKTPFSTGRQKPGQYSYELRLSGYVAPTVTLAIPRDGTTNRPALVVLKARNTDKGGLIVDVKPPGLRPYAAITNLTEQQFSAEAPGSFELTPGQQVFEILLPPPWTARRFELPITKDPDQRHVQPIPAGRLEFDSTPPGAAVWSGTNLVGWTPTNRLWPTGAFVFEWRLPNHATNRLETNLLDGATVTRSEKLKELLSPVRLVANLEGVRVYATNAQLGRLGPWLVGTNGTNIDLSGTNTLFAEFGDEQIGALAPLVISNATARLAFTNQYRFDFEYGLVAIRPPAVSTLTVGNVVLAQRPVAFRYQKPGEASTYKVAAPHFEPALLPLTVAQGQTLTTNVALAEKLYDLFLEVTPDAAQVAGAAGEPPLRRGANKLRWGTGRCQITVSHPRLQSLTTNVDLAEEGVTQRVQLAFAKMAIDTKQRGLKVVADGQEDLGVTPLTDLYLRPGAHTFTFTPPQGGTNAQWTFTFANQSVFATNLPFQFMPILLKNTVGMTLLYVPELDSYVDKFEMTRGEFARVMPPKPDGAACNAPDCPVVQVSWEEAAECCRKLTESAAEKAYLSSVNLEGWSYRLPAEAEWKVLAATNDVDCFAEANLFDPKTSDLNNMKPEAVSEGRKSFNKFNLYDLYGNVSEFCSGPAGEKLIIGGNYLTPRRTARKALAESNDTAVNTGAPEVGFRMILKHKP